jgi:hypothetical protein
MNKETITELKSNTVAEQKAELLQQLKLLATEMSTLVDNIKQDISKSIQGDMVGHK